MEITEVKILAESVFTVEEAKEEQKDNIEDCTWNSIEQDDPNPVTFSVKEENNAEEEELEPPAAVFIEPIGKFEDEDASMEEETDPFSSSSQSTPVTSRTQDVNLYPRGEDDSHCTDRNSVNSLLVCPFMTRSLEEKVEIKRLGRPTPFLKITQSVQTKNRSFNRKFNSDIYNKYEWICGCQVKNALFCFCCVLFGGEDPWAKHGVNDLQHLHDRAKKHISSKVHVKNALSLVLFGNVNVAQQVNISNRRTIEVHNQKVAQNRHVLNIIINCIKFSGSFELALHGLDESETSNNVGIFRGLINFSAELDSAMRNHLGKESIFEGFSKSVLNEILTYMLEVCHEEISKEIKNSEFVALIADETSFITSTSQLIIVYRYLVNFKPVERFWGFVNPEGHTAESFAACILPELHHHLDGCEKKLIAQTYDGACIMSGPKHGVEAIIKQKYKHARYIHCHAHQLNLILLNAASVNESARIFYANFEGLCSFISNSPEITSVFDELIQDCLLKSDPNRWNIHSRSVNTVLKHRAEVILCMKKIQQRDRLTSSSVCQASGFIGILNDENFIYWLSIFQKIMPHIDTLCNQLQRCDCTPTTVRATLKAFELELLKIRSRINITPDQGEVSKKRKLEKGARKREALEVCDAILMEIADRFSFVAHLGAALLFLPSKFPEYDCTFPEELVKDTLEEYAFIDEKKICTELSIIYCTEEFSKLSGPVSLMEFIRDNNINSTFSECVKLLSVILTIPMMTSEAEWCFSHLERIKTFLRNTTSEEKLSALAMLYIEQDFIRQIADFNERVINKFSSNKERCANFIYRQVDLLSRRRASPRNGS